MVTPGVLPGARVSRRKVGGMMWRLMDWLDDRWSAQNGRKVVRDEDWPDRHPWRWAAGLVPLSTWLRHPVDGWQSYRRVVVPLRLEREMNDLSGGPG
jgi:hypothetical protein